LFSLGAHFAALRGFLLSEFTARTMNTASSPRARSITSSLFGKWQRIFRSDNAGPEACRLEAAQKALAQAMSPAERVHAIHQAQSAGVPLHEIERELDWADARAAAGMR
jgi:hypothetical protein